MGEGFGSAGEGDLPRVYRRAKTLADGSSGRCRGQGRLVFNNAGSGPHAGDWQR